MDNYTVEKRFLVCCCIVICVISMCVTASVMHRNYLDNKLKINAIEAGYEQRVENNFLVWTKSNFGGVELQ